MKLNESIMRNLKESQNNDRALADFIKDSVEKLQTTDYTNCKYNLDEDLAVFVGWSGGYDENPTENEIASEKNPTYRINAAVKVRNDAMWTDLDDLTTPYYVHDGEAYLCEFTVSPSEDYIYLAGSLLQAYEEIKEGLASGELTLGNDELKEEYNEEANEDELACCMCGAIIDSPADACVEDDSDPYPDVYCARCWNEKQN